MRRWVPWLWAQGPSVGDYRVRCLCSLTLPEVLAVTYSTLLKPEAQTLACAGPGENGCGGPAKSMLIVQDALGGVQIKCLM